MRVEKFIGLFREGSEKLIRNPLIVIPGLILWAVLLGISRISVKVNYNLSNSISLTAWVILIALVTYLFMAFTFAGIIGMVYKASKGRVKISDFTSNAKKFGLKNYLIILIIIVLSILIGRIAFYGATFIGRAFNLGLGAAEAVFILIYFAGLIGVLIFFTFSSFFLVIDNLGVKESIKRSFRLVRREYLSTVALSLALFILAFLVRRIPTDVGSIVEYGLAIPFFALILVGFILANRK